jgi:hypothetical protein
MHSILGEGFLAIGSLANQLHVSLTVYQRRNPLAQHRVIIHH